MFWKNVKQWFVTLGAKLAQIPHAGTDGMINVSRDPVKFVKTLVIVAVAADLILRGRLGVISFISSFVTRAADYIVDSSVKSGLALVAVIAILAFWHITVVNGRKPGN